MLTVLEPSDPQSACARLQLGVFAPSASGMVDFEAATKTRLLACDDLPSSREWMTWVRLSLEWSQLRWRQVLVDRSATANGTRGFASCWRPIRCPDR